MPTCRTAFAAAAAAAALAAVPAHAAEEQAPQRTITVSGTANVLALNDTAGFATGVDVRRSGAAEALRAAAARMSRILRAVEAEGVDKHDLRTGQASVRKVRRHGVVAYVATTTVFVTVRRITHTGAVIDAAVNAGANQLRGLSFWRSNKRDLYRQALVAALRKAHANAQALADEAGATLGPVQTIAESEMPVYSYDRASGGALEPARAAPMPVRTGRTRVTADLTVVYALQ